MKIIGALILLVGILLVIGGVGYSLNLILEQSRRTYTCSQVETNRKNAEKAEEDFKAARGTPQEKDLESKLKKALELASNSILWCSEERSFYKTWITAGFLIAGGGLVVSLIGLGIFLFGRRRQISEL
jgi:hypothetical protein